MWDVIWKGKFPEIPKSRKNNITPELDDLIELWEAWSNVVFFQEIEKNDEIDDFKDLIVEIIDDIINLWMEDFRMHIWKGKYWNLYEDTTDIWNEMFIKACWIEDWLKYMEEEDEFPFELDDSYILQAISDILNPYQKTVFNELKQKYKSKEQ